MNNDIIIVGAFHEMVELCEDCGFHIVGIIDNKMQEDYCGYPILGTDDDRDRIHEENPECNVVISPDLPAVRIKLSKLYGDSGYHFATVISPKANISRTATIGVGSVIQQGVNVSAGTAIGEYVKINTYANVMHDNIVGDFATIAPNAVLLGYVNIGRSAYIGANSTILPYVVIGSSATVGAGAVVTKNVSQQRIVKGVPAR